MSQLTLDSLSAHDDATLAYFSYYAIDFETRFPATHHFGSLDLAGYRIAVHYYQNARPTGCCLVVHGYFDHSGLYGHLIEYCLQQGRDVVVWDLPGHGLSSGEFASINSFHEYRAVFESLLDQLGSRLPRPLTFIGQSTGGAILLGWLLHRAFQGQPSPDGRINLLAPLIRPRGWHAARFVYSIARPFRRAVKRKFSGGRGTNPEFQSFLLRDPMQSRVLPLRWVGAMREWISEFNDSPHCPAELLVIQGDEDDVVDWRYNLTRIASKLANTEVRMIRGAGHHLVNATEALRTEVFRALRL